MEKEMTPQELEQIQKQTRKHVREIMKCSTMGFFMTGYYLVVIAATRVLIKASLWMMGENK